MSIYTKKGEEPTAKDSMITDLKLRWDQLYSLHNQVTKDYKDTLHENMKLKFELAQLKGKLQAMEELEVQKKKMKLNRTYDGIQEY